MRLSTVVELAGFGVISAAAWQLSPNAGLFVAGFALLLIGYATNDDQAIVAVKRIVDPLRARRARKKAQRAERKARRKEAASRG